MRWWNIHSQAVVVMQFSEIQLKKNFVYSTGLGFCFLTLRHDFFYSLKNETLKFSLLRSQQMLYFLYYKE